MNRWYHILFKKRLSLSLFIILPAVIGLTAFASGFIALILIETLIEPDSASFVSPTLIQVKELMRYIRLEVLLFSTMGLLAGLGIAYAILNPIKRIMGRAQQVALGNFDARLDIEHLDELAGLGKDFNSMVSSLNKYFVENIAVGWALLDPTGKIVSINPGASLILGRQPDDLPQQRFCEFTQPVTPRKGLDDLIAQCIQTQAPLQNERVELITGDNRKTNISFSIALLKADEGKLTGLAVTIKDPDREQAITEHIHRTDQLAALGTMAAGLAHEIRNPLGSIKGLTQLLQEEFPAGGKGHTYTQTITREIDRLNGVMTHLLNFAQPSSGNHLPCDLNQLLDKALDLCRLEIEQKEIRLKKNLSPSLPKIFGDGKKLVQAFLNILLNAVQVTETRGGIGLTTRFDPRMDLEPGMDNKGLVLVEIVNDGPPIDPKLADRIFDPFFSTKDGGTGLGLAITQQIVALHHGLITHSTREGQTVFSLKFHLTGNPDTPGRRAVEPTS